MPRAEPTVEWVPGLLAVSRGRARAVYAVGEIPCDDGRAFALRKVEGGTDPEADGYVVRVTRGGVPQSCECRSWLARGYCVHSREVGKLVSEGKL